MMEGDMFEKPNFTKIYRGHGLKNNQIDRTILIREEKRE